jgi:hypothetical protein
MPAGTRLNRAVFLRLLSGASLAPSLCLALQLPIRLSGGLACRRVAGLPGTTGPTPVFLADRHVTSLKFVKHSGTAMMAELSAVEM